MTEQELDAALKDAPWNKLTDEDIEDMYQCFKKEGKINEQD